jgi:hypothetical protein
LDLRKENAALVNTRICCIEISKIYSVSLILTADTIKVNLAFTTVLGYVKEELERNYF